MKFEYIRNRIHVYTLKKTTTLVFVILLFILLFYYFLSFIVDYLYYDPTTIAFGNTDNGITFDIYAISELNSPGISPSTVLVNRKGFGKYKLMYSYRDVFTNESYEIVQEISRNNIYKDNSMIQNLSQFYDIKNSFGLIVGSDKEDIVKKLTKLDPFSLVSISVLFQNDLSMEELRMLELKYSNIHFEWSAIRTHSNIDIANDIIGIQLLNSKRNSVLLGDEEISKKYPAFFILDWLVKPLGKENNSTSLEAQAYINHYISVLEYLVDRSESINVLEYYGKDATYKLALEHAKKNGVRTYGVLIFGEAQEILKFIKSEKTSGLNINSTVLE